MILMQGLQEGLFQVCGYDTDDYLVDTVSMKNLISAGSSDGAFPGLQFDKVMTNSDDLSVFARAFSGAVDSQAVGVLKHSSDYCFNIEHFEHYEDATLLPSTSSSINLSSSCSGTSQRWKLIASPDDASIRIHHRRSQDYCLSHDDDGVVKLLSCDDAGDKAKWKLGGGNIKKFATDNCLDVSSGTISVQACNGGTTQVWSAPPVLNAADLEMNFDHSASSGMYAFNIIYVLPSYSPLIYWII